FVFICHLANIAVFNRFLDSRQIEANILLYRMFCIIVEDENMVLFHARFQVLPERRSSVWKKTIRIQKVSHGVVQPLAARTWRGVNQTILTVTGVLDNWRERIQVAIYRSFGNFKFLHQVAAVNNTV